MSGSLNDHSIHFSLLGDDLSVSFDSEGEKSKPREKVSTVVMGSAFEKSNCELFTENFKRGLGQNIFK
jgi:hypothetical protein